MALVVDQIKGFLPDFHIPGFSNILVALAFLILFIIVSGIIFFIWLDRRKFRNKIVIFEEINGRLEPTRRDMAAELKIGNAGDTLFFFKKHKKYLPNGTLQMGRRTFWYAIREDGEWVNFDLGSINEISRKMGIKFVQKDMALSRIEIERALRHRYDKPAFWAQYGPVIVSLLFIIIVGIMIYLLFNKWTDLAATTNSAVQTANEVMKTSNQILTNLDRICTGSGIVPAAG